ncbi:MAG: type 4a pilus biogenesis protein PilO [Candidatus Omnitrophica bacterium]|nr:type 4a pilus biogenesis protein PilO [Candidatus Omnitrophota bacterium]
MNSQNILNFIRKNQAVAAVIGAASAGLIVYVLFFAPLTRKLGPSYLECRSCESEVAEGRNLIGYARNIDKSYGRRVLLSEKDAASAIEDITGHGKVLGINFISIKPRDVVIKEGLPYKILPIEMEMEATDRQFVDFIGSIDELKKAIVTVDSFDIKPDRIDREKLSAKMVIDIYLSLKETGSEEI